MIETERLIVRPWRDGDRDVYLATCNSESVTAHLGGPMTVEDIDAGLERIRVSQAENGFCFWAVERKSDGAFLGYCGLKIANDGGTPIDGEIEMGWRLREDAQGQGYVTEAARACLRWAWANLEVARVVAITVPANERSWRVMERLGMTRCRELDYAHPRYAPDDPLSRHITYAMERPRS